MPDSKTIYFTVDSQLLRELGERLVGRQYIALAELIKNSYDADATKVEILIQGDCIEVSDNGHGITPEQFTGHWMRVGSTHKVRELTSPEFHRPLTGSKGVGRLSVQFLASEMELTSVPQNKMCPTVPPPRKLTARVNWDRAVQAGELTQATAQYELDEPKDTIFPLGKPHGTTVRLKRLRHAWQSKDFEDLAGEVWFLQPPFRSLAGTTKEEEAGFEVALSSPDSDTVSLFNTRMSDILQLYRSRIVGKLLPIEGRHKGTKKRRVQLSLELERQPAQTHQYDIPLADDTHCLLDKLEFEIRIFYLRGRQGYGIPVNLARNYIAQWGGVHIYDAGFRIPYAGAAADWLRLEVDHSHRLHASRLLPRDLHVPLGLNHLPTNSRVLGVVNIDTTRRTPIDVQVQHTSTQHLQIQVSRDRLVDNDAFHQLRDTVRYALDYYATRMAIFRKEKSNAEKSVNSPTSLVKNVWDVLEQHEKEIPRSVATQLRTELGKTMDSIRDQSEWTRNQSGLLGAMATAGATAMALDHQFNQQLNILEHHAVTLENVTKTNPELKESIGPISNDIKGWIKDARDTRGIFSPISDQRNREAEARFKAKPLVESMAGSIRPIMRGIKVDTSAIDENLLLPMARYPVWMAILNNVLMNASNALLDSDVRQISVSSCASGRRRGIRIQDTGIGIDLEKAEDLFEPLQRGLEISPERRSLGYGGTGLGLAIVRMLATDLKADVRFIKPTPPFNTCFEMVWNEDL